MATQQFPADEYWTQVIEQIGLLELKPRDLVVQGLSLIQAEIRGAYSMVFQSQLKEIGNHGETQTLTTFMERVFKENFEDSGWWPPTLVELRDSLNRGYVGETEWTNGFLQIRESMFSMVAVHMNLPVGPDPIF